MTPCTPQQLSNVRAIADRCEFDQPLSQEVLQRFYHWRLQSPELVGMDAIRCKFQQLIYEVQIYG